MDEATARLIQAWAAIGSAAVALLSFGVAVAATLIASSAKKVAEASVDVSEQSVALAKRQIALAAMPYLVLTRWPTFDNKGSGSTYKIRVHVTNPTSTPAFSVQTHVWGAKKRFKPIESTRVKSSQRPHVAPGEPEAQLNTVATTLMTAEPGRLWLFPHFVIRLSYHGPHGGTVSQWYDWNGKQLYRIFRIVVDPGDGGEPIDQNLSL